MHLQTLKTPTVLPNDNLQQILRTAIDSQLGGKLPEKSVLAITSKIVSLCEGRVVPMTPNSEDHAEKHALARQEAELYLDPGTNRYNLMLTIVHGVMVVNAGIDESNVPDAYVLYPADPWASAREIWEFLRTEYGVQELGVIITDSTSFPLKWGVVGRSISHCGFIELNSRVGELDLFGRPIEMTQVNVSEGIAGAAVFCMGEVAESTPLVLATEIPHIRFQDRPPTEKEIKELRIELEDDMYGSILKQAPWKSERSS